MVNLGIKEEVEWKTVIERLLCRLKGQAHIKFKNWCVGLEQGTDLVANIELTDEERAALEWFCAHTALIRGELEIEPKTRTIILNGEIEPVVFPF